MVVVANAGQYLNRDAPGVRIRTSLGYSRVDIRGLRSDLYDCRRRQWDRFDVSRVLVRRVAELSCRANIDFQKSRLPGSRMSDRTSKDNHQHLAQLRSKLHCCQEYGQHKQDCIDSHRCPHTEYRSKSRYLGHYRKREDRWDGWHIRCFDSLPLSFGRRKP